MNKIITELDKKLDEFLSELNETQRLVFIQLYLSSAVQEKVIIKEIERYNNARKHSQKGV